VTLDYLPHLAADSARFRAAILLTEPTDRVPTCPDWAADDLLWHLAEVQWFWGTIADQRLQDPEASEGQKPERPASREGLLAFFDESTELLQRALRETAPEVEVWTWANDHSIGFIRRRQAHEALIHRLDAELTAGERTPLDPELAEDGVDEVLRVMYGGEPDWGTFTADPARTVSVEVAGSGRAWVATLGRFTGTSPDGETTYEDEPDMRIAPDDGGGQAGAAFSGSAADLDCWLWNRPLVGDIARDGDADTLAAFEQTIASGID
jgi:uncharacterized protein (TIGR03083 family)